MEKNIKQKSYLPVSNPNLHFTNAAPNDSTTYTRVNTTPLKYCTYMQPQSTHFSEE